MNARPRVGYDNVAFDSDGMRIVGTVVGYDHDGLMIVSNDYFDDVWHVAIEDATITDEPMNHPPANW